MANQNFPTAIASATCSDCGRQFSTKVHAPDGANSAYVRCAACRHINHTTDFEAGVR